MFGINFKHKKDIRKLLTDYSNFENPLLKSYPSEGFFDVFYRDARGGRGSRSVGPVGPAILLKDNFWMPIF